MLVGGTVFAAVLPDGLPLGVHLDQEVAGLAAVSRSTADQGVPFSNRVAR